MTLQLGHPIRQHDDIEAAAEEKADAVIGKLRDDLESAYQAALDTTSRDRALEMLTQGRNPQLCREALEDRRSELQTPWCAGGRGRLLEGIGETVVAGDLS